MPEADHEGKTYYTDVPQQGKLFFLKGSNELDWGMKNRLSRIFNPADGRTVMLAIDHGYFQGPTSGLERIDVSILPLLPEADVLMCTRGILRTVVPPSVTIPVVMRASGGPSILKELSDEEIAMDMEDCIRLGVCATAIQVFIGGEFESRSVVNMTRLVDAGLRYGIPTLAVTAVGQNLERNAKYFRLATRVGELTRIFLTELEARHAKREASLFGIFKRTKKVRPGYKLVQGRIDIADPGGQLGLGIQHALA